MKKSDVFKAIIKIQEYCNKQKSCEECDLAVIDAWDDELTCILNCCPSEWDTDALEENNA